MHVSGQRKTIAAEAAITNDAQARAPFCSCVAVRPLAYVRCNFDKLLLL